MLRGGAGGLPPFLKKRSGGFQKSGREQSEHVDAGSKFTTGKKLQQEKRRGTIKD